MQGFGNEGIQTPGTSQATSKEPQWRGSNRITDKQSEYGNTIHACIATISSTDDIKSVSSNAKRLLQTPNANVETCDSGPDAGPLATSLDRTQYTNYPASNHSGTNATHMPVSNGRNSIHHRPLNRKRKFEYIEVVDCFVQDGEQQPVECCMCGKQYSQHNSYFKHLYEHHPSWTSVSRRFRLSKHQQVIMMQSAQALLSFKRPNNPLAIPCIRI